MKNRLLNQWEYLRKIEVYAEIENQANELYTKRYNNNNYYLADKMCNYKLLEEKCEEYKEILIKCNENPEEILNEIDDALNEETNKDSSTNQNCASKDNTPKIL